LEETDNQRNRRKIHRTVSGDRTEPSTDGDVFAVNIDVFDELDRETQKTKSIKKSYDPINKKISSYSLSK
jgi:hypothetical protein